MPTKDPRYPIYIPSKGRSHAPLSITMFLRESMPFHVVVEPQEVEAYSKVAGEDRVLCLPESGRGLTYSRNWIRQHAIDGGATRHWQFDDDIRYMRRVYRGHRIRMPARIAICAAEDFCDRYENVGLASFNSQFFVPSTEGSVRSAKTPFILNGRCYTVLFVNHATGLKFRGRYNEDTDMTLQTLSSGWCTILFQAFVIATPKTMSSRGGQTAIYGDDGRLKMARALERAWPGVVTTHRRFGRPQHVVAFQWKRFDTKLIRRAEHRDDEAKSDEYGLELVARKDTEYAADLVKKLSCERIE